MQGSDKSQGLEHPLLNLAVEDRIHVLQHLGTHVEEAPLVLDGDENPFGAVIHGHLKRLRHRTSRFDVALNAHVAEDDYTRLR